MKPSDRIEITGAAGCVVRATVIHVFERAECQHETAAFTFRNMARVIFSELPVASRVVLVATQRPTLLFLVEAAHRWFDVTAQPVKVSVAVNAPSEPEAAIVPTTREAI
jgi:hypothetical protein